MVRAARHRRWAPRKRGPAAVPQRLSGPGTDDRRLSQRRHAAAGDFALVVGVAHVLPHPQGAWTFSGSSHPDRRDWVHRVSRGFEQRNFMGMNASDYGGGTPVSTSGGRDLRAGGRTCGNGAEAGRAAGRERSRRDESRSNASRLIRSSRVESVYDRRRRFLAVHRGDYFATLDAYRRMHGRARPARRECAGADAYEPIWCAWGYERDFTRRAGARHAAEGARAGARLGRARRRLADRGRRLVAGPGEVPARRRRHDRVRQGDQGAGMQPQAVDCAAAPSIREPTCCTTIADMLLLDEDGAVQNVTWWNSFYLCPAYPPTVELTPRRWCARSSATGASRA